METTHHNDSQNGQGMSRRSFFKRMAAGSVAVASAAAVNRVQGAPLPQIAKMADGQSQGQMTYRTTPTTGDKVSLLGYGCMRWPTLRGDRNGEYDQETINQLVDYAIEHGVNYFDSSPVYCRGLSEKITGIALSRHPRNKYFIATKLSNASRAYWSREASMKMYHDSFVNFQTDYIDYYLLHSVGGGSGIREFEQRYVDNGMLDFLLEERKAGRIRNLGFSFHGQVEVFDHLLSLQDKYHWDFVQIQLNYQDWRHAQETSRRNINAEYLYNELHKRNIPAVIMEPLLGGRLSRVPDFVAGKFKQREPEMSVASWAFRFAGSPEGVLTVLSGMTYMEHLQDNIKTYSPLQPLSQEERDFLESQVLLMLRYPTIPCNECDYCMPCPYGLDIPAIFHHYNQCLNEDRIPASSQDKNYRKARREFLIGYDRSVPALRQADHCIGCRHCVSHCPQNINIPAQMQRINKFVEDLKQGREF